jgi:hypothetical protein
MNIADSRDSASPPLTLNFRKGNYAGSQKAEFRSQNEGTSDET